MSIEKLLTDLKTSIDENTKSNLLLVKALKIEGVKPEWVKLEKADNTPSESEEKVCKAEAEKGARESGADMKAGLGEKPNEPARADAPAQKASEPVPEQKPEEVKAPEKPVDEAAEKTERTRICSTLFGVLKGSMGAQEAKAKTREVIDAFTGGSPASEVPHEQHEAFMAHMNKAIEEAQNG